jgi:hypothetical protein
VKLEKIKNCPFHGCRDLTLTIDDDHAYVISLDCGIRGQKYPLKALGKETASEMAIVDWNAQESV